MFENPSSLCPSGRGKEQVKGLDTRAFPVETVDWERASEFCKRLSFADRRSGLKYRLPTEAEWEYAARAGTVTPFHWGSSCNGREANFDGAQPYGTELRGPWLARTVRVGSYPPNAFGLHDMHGNVMEWCSDWYSENYYKKSPLQNPTGPTENDPNTIPGDTLPGGIRVVRGGNFEWSGSACRSGERHFEHTIIWSWTLGFRVVAEREGSPPSRLTTSYDSDIERPYIGRFGGLPWNGGGFVGELSFCTNDARLAKLVAFAISA